MQPDIAHLVECLYYDPEVGFIIWRNRPQSHFKTLAAFKTHARRRAGRLAGCIDDSTGYLVIGMGDKLLYGHRVAWALLHGEWPRKHIDHIDGDKTNNTAANLRSVSQAENNRNTPLKKTNTSGSVGISYAKGVGKWRARITHDYRSIHCGSFNTREEAEQARRDAEKALGFHPNHGRSI